MWFIKVIQIAGMLMLLAPIVLLPPFTANVALLMGLLLMLMIVHQHLYIHIYRYRFWRGNRPFLRPYNDGRMVGFYGRLTRNYNMTIAWRM
jgi:hypothetical protein